MSQVGAAPVAHTGVMVAETELHGGALSFPAIIAQSFTHISPGLAFLLAGTFVASQVGFSMPLAYLGGAIICIAIAITLAILAQAWPSAASYFTYVSRALHPRAGFLVGWMYLLYDPIIGVTCATIFGVLLESEAQTRWGLTIPWWATTAVMVLAASSIAWFGIKISGRLVLALALIELAILVLFGLSGLANPGPGGFSFLPFTVDPKFGINGLAFGVALVIMAFTGFEAAVPLAEESRNPRKYVPWAVVGSVVIASLFLVACTFGLVIGWGTDTFDTGFAGQPVGAFFTLAERLWGAGWVLILVVLGNSAFGAVLSCSLVTNRLLFGYARAGVLPAWLGKVNNHVPRNAILATTVISFIWGYAIGFWIGGDNAYFWTALILTWAVILIYGSGAVSVTWHWYTKRRQEFSWFWHGIVPVGAILALAVSFWLSLPSLTGIYWWTLPINGAWIVAGIVILVYFRVSKKEGWLIKSVQFANEHEATAEELAMLEQEP